MSTAPIAIDDPFLDTEQAAEIPHVHFTTILRAYRSGRLKGIKINGSRILRFRKSWVLAWLEGENQTGGIMSAISEREEWLTLERLVVLAESDPERAKPLLDRLDSVRKGKK